MVLRVRVVRVRVRRGWIRRGNFWPFIGKPPRPRSGFGPVRSDKPVFRTLMGLKARLFLLTNLVTNSFLYGGSESYFA
jgi:hypothetical protein